MARSYQQFCGLAHALDLAGERWTLLIVRELLAGPCRYTDLRDGLVSIPTNLLAARLREMQDNGLIARRRLPAPASSVVVYELTAEGERLGDAILELTRWGMRTLPADAGARPFRARWLVLALRAGFDPHAARGVSEAYELHVEDDDVVSLEIRDGEGAVHVGPAQDPAVRISADAETLAALIAGALDGAAALGRGARVEGEPAALARMRAILPARST